VHLLAEAERKTEREELFVLQAARKKRGAVGSALCRGDSVVVYTIFRAEKAWAHTAVRPYRTNDNISTM
jgi:hypothetical protein